MTREIIKATGWGTLATLTVALLIVIGSRNLSHFDAALVGYTFAVLFATFGVTYRYAMWLQRPPTALYWKRGWQVFLRPKYLARNVATWCARLTHEFALNHFIARRGAMGGAYDDYVGMLDCDRHYIPPGLRLDSFRNAARGRELVSRLRLRLPHFRLPDPFDNGVSDLPWAGLVIDPGDRRGDAGDAAANERSRRGGGATVRRGLPVVDPPLRHQRDGVDAHGKLHMDERIRLRLPGHHARDHRDLHTAFVLLALFAILCFVVIFKSGSKPDIKTHLVSDGVAA
jgi:hypothetical protein